MSNLGKLAITAVAIGSLSGCAGFQLGNAERTQAKGSSFEKNLYSEYVMLSKSEYKEGDYQDSDNFALRAISAAKGKPTSPEALASRRLPQGASGELGDARVQLVSALGKGAAQKMPKDAAHAQAMFDCWMQEQEENFQPKDIARCRAGFLSAMSKINAGMKPVKVATAPPPKPMPKKLREDFIVYFPFDKSGAVGSEAAKVTAAIDAAKRIGAKEVTLAGHTDRAGPNKYNEILSLRRVRGVANAFTGAGIKANIISSKAFGEKVPAISTKDGVAEQKNRRVVIQIGN